MGLYRFLKYRVYRSYLTAVLAGLIGAVGTIIYIMMGEASGILLYFAFFAGGVVEFYWARFLNRLAKQVKTDKNLQRTIWTILIIRWAFLPLLLLLVAIILMLQDMSIEALLSPRYFNLMLSAIFILGAVITVTIMLSIRRKGKHTPAAIQNQQSSPPVVQMRGARQTSLRFTGSQERQRIISSLNVGDSVLLHLGKGSRIKVEYKQNEIGYLPQELADQLAAQLDLVGQSLVVGTVRQVHRDTTPMNVTIGFDIPTMKQTVSDKPLYERSANPALPLIEPTHEEEKKLTSTPPNQLANKQIETALTGNSYAKRQAVIRRLTIGASVLLMGEPENPYDPNAVRVEFEGEPAGYLPQALAKSVSARLAEAQDTPLDGTVTQLYAESEQTDVFNAKIRFILPGAPIEEAPTAVVTAPLLVEPADKTLVEPPAPQKDPVPPQYQSVSTPAASSSPKRSNDNGCLIFVLILVGLMIGGYFLGEGKTDIRKLISQLAPTETSAPTSTPRPTATPRPTQTRTRRPTRTATVRKPSSTPRSSNTGVNSNGCQRWDTVTLADVGDEMCVYGIVRNAWIDYQQNAFFMTFGTEPGDMYMVVYNGWYFEEVENHCVQFEGEVMQLGQTPVFAVNPGTLYHCD